MRIEGAVFINRRSGGRTAVYGDIVEGEIKKGMSLLIPFNPSFSMAVEIEAIEFIDIEIGKESRIGLVLKPEENPKEEFDFYYSLNFFGEVLDIGSA